MRLKGNVFATLNLLLSIFLLFSPIFADKQVPISFFDQEHASGNPSKVSQRLRQTSNFCKDNSKKISPLDVQLMNIDLDDLEMTITSSNNSFNGYNLFALEQQNVTDHTWKGLLLITDMDGNVITTKEGIGAPVEFINSTTILGASATGAVLWNIHDNTTTQLGFIGHHEYEYNSNNDTFFSFYVYDIEVNGTLYGYDMINEYDSLGQLIWSLKTDSFISHTQWCPFHDTWPGGTADLTHSNTIFFDAEEDMIYYNSRNVNTFYKIDHKTGTVLWGLGEHGNFTLFDQSGNQREHLFFHAHSIEKVGKNTFILFDNDYHNQTDSENKRSRVVEITLNETSMTANESWAWTAPLDYYSYQYGDADRLPNGNRLGTFGTEHPGSTTGARLVEVNDSGEIVWELNFRNFNKFAYYVYRMERFHFTPILSSPPDFQTLSKNNVTISWQTWYNFRTKMPMPGSYMLYLDGALLESGPHLFDKFWQPTNLTFNLGRLKAGQHNLTLALADEGGHIVADSLNVSVTSSFYLDRIGPLAIELGQANSFIQWEGDTPSPLLMNLTLNNSKLASYEWNGSIIRLDLNSLEVGGHLIAFHLFNDSVLAYNDSFWVRIHSSAPPLINKFPADQSLTWNDSLILFWDFFDHAPSSWAIFANNTLLASNRWDLQAFQLNWSVPELDEGSYNVTLLLEDLVGHQTTHTLWLIVIPPSPPIIAATPEQTTLQWGQENVSLIWEVHGGTSWALWRNGTVIQTGELDSKYVEVPIKSWQDENWRPSTYNLTLQVTGEMDLSVTHTSWVRIEINMGDAYANVVTTGASLWYSFGENAVGAPDGRFAQIFVDYENGYLTLDMGLHEEIIDGSGPDFMVVAQGGNYTVLVGNDLSQPLSLLGMGKGNQSFNLADAGIASVRYVRIEYRAGADVELDAISALYYNQPTGDHENPQIIGPIDFWIWANQTAVILTWEALDATPWNYSIWINENLVETGSWNGSDIDFVLTWTSSGNVSITLILFDVFGNRAENTVHVDIRPIPSLNSKAKSKNTTIPLVPVVLSLFFVLIWRLRWKSRYYERK
ncbi:MAG: aryl-sulfate sulfotransferase [Candidatus Heimdallarchaeota archaeon]